MKIIKGFALLLPTIIGVALLIIVLLRFTGTMDDIQVLEAKMNSLIGIIGVAVAVWIGLNVYNIAERKEIEVLQAKIKQLDEDAERYKKNQEHLSSQIQISGATLFRQAKMLEQRNWLESEKPLVGGSEFSYLDYIEGFVLRFEEYARENNKLDFPQKIDFFDLYFYVSKSIYFFITEKWEMPNRDIRLHDVMHINKILDKIDSLCIEELFCRLDEETYKNNINVLKLNTHGTIIAALERIDVDEVLIIKSHILEQEKLIEKMLRPL